MARTKKLSNNEKVKIITLHEGKINNSEIARRVKCSETSVRNLIKKLKESGNLDRKKGSGKKKKTTKRDERHLKRLCLQNRFGTASEIKEEFEKISSTRISVRTVQRRLNELGLLARKPAKKPLLTRKMKKKRLEWAKTYSTWDVNDWRKVVFSDESKFNLIGPDGFQSVRRRKGERYSEECLVPTVKHSSYVMVWGAITSKGVGRMVIIDGTVDAKKYKNIIDEGVVPTIEELCTEIPEPIFQDDSAPCHRARSIQNYKQEIGIKSLEWPVNSPDLNPIENIWAIMAKKLRKSRPKNYNNLVEKLENIWYEQITTELIQNLYTSMPHRINAVIKAKGGATKY